MIALDFLRRYQAFNSLSLNASYLVQLNRIRLDLKRHTNGMIYHIWLEHSRSVIVSFRLDELTGYFGYPKE